MDARLREIPLLFPGRHFHRYPRLAVEPSVQALAIHDVDLRFGHVQPTAVLGGVMKFDLIQEPTRFFRSKRLVEARAVMRVQVVLHQANPLGLGAMPVHQLPDTFGIVSPRTAFCHLHMTPPPQRFAQHQLMADPLPLILIIDPGRPTPARPLCRSHLTKQLLARFIEAHHGIARVVGQHIGLQHILHAPDELRVRLGGDTPGPDDPGLNVIFFSACHTVTVLMVSTKPKTTSSSASSCKVQWQRPHGGSLQASSSNFCSTFPLILTLSGRGGCGRWSRAASRPSVTNRFRRRSIVRGLVPKAETISASAYASPHHASAKSKMRAWVSFRAAAWPMETNCSNASRSSTVSATRYLSIAELLSLRHSLLPQPQETAFRVTRQSKINGTLERLCTLVSQHWAASAEAIKERVVAD